METKDLKSATTTGLLAQSEFNRFGIICVLLTVVGCLGGTAVGLGAITSTFALILVVVPTMLTLSLLLAVAPMRAIYTAALTSVSIDIALILYFALV
jgi:hypothetical protein